MHTNERFDKILDHLKLHKRASVADLSRLLYVSEATVRRDLNDMQRMGLLKRTHGGAVYADGSEEVSIFVRQEVNAPWKEATAAIALPHLPDFRTVFIDNSSTCLALAERMNLAHKTVVTNGLQIAMRISRHDDVNLIMPGGEVRFNTAAVLGSMAANSLGNFNFDLAITSCSAVNAEGAYELSLESMQIKRTALTKSRKRILIFDNTKVNTSATFKTASLDNYDYIFSNAGDALLKSINPDGTKNILNR